MKITFLGTGTSQGVPIIGCHCEVCTSADARDKRLRSSILVSYPNCQIVVDTGPDFRYQMLREKVEHLDAVLFTHGHKDHLAGLDDIRAFNYFQQKAMDVYADAPTQEQIRNEFSYIFKAPNYPGIPKINMLDLNNNSPLTIKGHTIIPIQVMHYKLPVFGFRFGDFSYITDANYIAPQELEKIKGSKVLVLNALRHEEHVSHFTLQQAIALGKATGVPQVYFTHLSHQMGVHQMVEKEYLQNGFNLAYDGLVINL